MSRDADARDRAARGATVLRRVLRPRGVVAVGGTLTLVVAAVAIHAPALSPVSTERARALAEALGPTGMVFGVGLFVAGYALLGVLSARVRRSDVDPLVESPPEVPQDGRTEVVAAAFDAAFETGARPDLLRSRLREAAVEARVMTAGVDRERAAEEVATGAWTDDHRAAAFLGDEVQRPPARVRLRDLVASEPRTRRYARHALAAVEDAWEGPAREVSDGD